MDDRYLLVNHVAVGPGSAPGRIRIGDLWLEDLKAQAKAIANAGLKLRVACPLYENFKAADGGSFNAVDIDPAEYGFEHAPLPFYNSSKLYVQVRRELAAALELAMTDAAVVQMDYGGYPVPLGSVAWPIAGKLDKRRIWLFDGGDPFPQWRVAAKNIRNPIKRWGRQLQIKMFEGFCHRAIAQANLVFAHNNSVVERFRPEWNEKHCHRFERSFVTEQLVVSKEQLTQRRAQLLKRDQPLRLVAAGRQIAIKGTDHLLRAMRAAIDRGAKLHLDVIGDGDELENYKALAGSLRLGEHVRFLGSVPYGKPLFDLWDQEQVMVVTNLTAEFSRNLLLSMARGLPLIMYSNPGDASLEAKGLTIAVPIGDEQKLADALVDAHRDREKLAAIAEKAREHAAGNTLDACHRKRATLAAALLNGSH
jgi:glycosyltransferase involved in cell wall biosynthesis